MIYTHVLNRGGRGVQSPVDKLCRLYDSSDVVEATVQLARADR
jgi:hypothetical protein